MHQPVVRTIIINIINIFGLYFIYFAKLEIFIYRLWPHFYIKKMNKSTFKHMFLEVLYFILQTFSQRISFTLTSHITYELTSQETGSVCALCRLVGIASFRVY